MDNEEIFEDDDVETIALDEPEEFTFVSTEYKEPVVLTTADLIAIYKLQKAGYVPSDFDDFD